MLDSTATDFVRISGHYGVVPVQPRGLNQAHDRRGTLARPQRSGKQPVRATQRDRAYPILYPVVVDGQGTVVEESRQRRPAAEAVVDGLGDRGAVGRLLSVQQQPFAQLVCDRSRLQLP